MFTLSEKDNTEMCQCVIFFLHLHIAVTEWGHQRAERPAVTDCQASPALIDQLL